MGRSVSTPRNAVLVAFDDWFDGEYEDEDTGETKYREAEHWDWEEYLYCLTERVKELWPSFEPCDNWLDREDRAIMENSLAYFGVSEYCGLAAIWMVPKDHDEVFNLAEPWLTRASKKFHANFGSLYKLGTMSNGEGVYQRKQA
jgi:hypothetical protein